MILINNKSNIITYKQKLIDLLKSDEQTKTAMEKLDFGYLIYINKYCKIIGLPLQERFIRMYCNSKNMNCNFQSNNLIFIWKDYLDKDDKNIEEGKLITYISFKDFDQQDDEVYKKIIEALYNF